MSYLKLHDLVKGNRHCYIMLVTGISSDGTISTVHNDDNSIPVFEEYKESDLDFVKISGVINKNLT